jgi:hypothetical protein
MPVTTVVAIYGAVLATITAVIQVLNHFRDRIKVLVKVRKNMSNMSNMDDPMVFVIVSAVNAGRRPVTIAGFSVKLLYRENERETAWYLPDVRPRLPHEIKEGGVVAAYLNQEGVDFNSIASWEAWDTAGRQFQLNEASWQKRWLSSWKRRRRRKRQK